MSKNVLTQTLSVPLGSTTKAIAAIHAGDGNLMIDGSTGSEPVLASGTLQYLEKQGQPIHSVAVNDGQANFTLKSGGKGQTWMRMPWSACNGATEWQVHLNPTVSLDITAHSDGGNVRLDLSGMAVTRVTADTGGGNMEVILPDKAAGISVDAKTGAGNVTVHIPDGIAARINASSGLGKVILPERFAKVDKTLYQSPDYESASEKVEITASSGAGNVIIEE